MALTQKIRCAVSAIAAHEDRVYTVELSPARRLPRFRPGQFLQLALDPYDPSRFWPESRAFSIASSPLERDRVRITYAVHGRFTTRMEAELAVGRELWVKLPYGEFVIDDRQGAVLFAGGTGVTAFTAFLQTTSTTAPIVLAYGARSKPLLIYRDLAAQCAARLPALTTRYFAESSPSDDPQVLPGMVSVEAVWQDVQQPADMLYYIAGPSPMLVTIGEDLRRRGVPPEAIRVDAWE